MVTNQQSLPVDPNVTEARFSQLLEKVGAAIVRYSIVALLLWIGALKFTAYEA
ncbi:MAG: DUF417 family protein [Gemmatimonadaceae bacterium]